MAECKSITMQQDWSSIRRFKAEHTPEQVAFVDAVFEMAERNYARGGDTIVECYEPGDVLEDFKTLDDAREACGMHVEQRLNARWGSDVDPELKQYEAFKGWEK